MKKLPGKTNSHSPVDHSRGFIAACRADNVAILSFSKFTPTIPRIGVLILKKILTPMVSTIPVLRFIYIPFRPARSPWHVSIPRVPSRPPVPRGHCAWSAALLLGSDHWPLVLLTLLLLLLLVAALPAALWCLWLRNISAADRPELLICSSQILGFMHQSMHN